MTTAEFFQLFTYTSNWNIPLNLVFIFIAIVYLLLTGPLAKKIPHGEPAKLSQKIYFLMACTVYYFAIGSPVNLLAHELFSIHMFQMSLLFIVLPPLLLLGLPAWMILPLRRLPVFKSIGAFLSRPLIILFLFNGAISIYHAPYVFDSIMNNALLHDLTHYILLILALFMWWPIMGHIPEKDQINPMHKIGFIFANGIMLTPACALIIFAETPMYITYQEISALAPIMTPLHDQALGGVIMKIVQEIVYIGAIGLILSKWFRIQKQKDKEEMSAWMESDSVIAKPDKV